MADDARAKKCQNQHFGAHLNQAKQFGKSLRRERKNVMGKYFWERPCAFQSAEDNQQQEKCAKTKIEQRSIAVKSIKNLYRIFIQWL